MADPYPDRDTVMHQWHMGVDKAWCGGIAKVMPDKIQKIRQGLEKLVGTSDDCSVGIFEDFVFAKGICSDWFYGKMRSYFEGLESAGDIVGEAVIVKANYGYFLNYTKWIEKLKKEHFGGDGNG